VERGGACYLVDFGVVHERAGGRRLVDVAVVVVVVVDVVGTGARHARLAATRRVRDRQASRPDADRQLRHRRHRRREPVALTQHQLLRTATARVIYGHVMRSPCRVGQQRAELHA